MSSEDIFNSIFGFENRFSVIDESKLQRNPEIQNNSLTSVIDINETLSNSFNRRPEEANSNFPSPKESLSNNREISNGNDSISENETEFDAIEENPQYIFPQKYGLLNSCRHLNQNSNEIQETLRIIQSTTSEFQYVVNIKKDGIQENFNTILWSPHVSVEKKEFSSINNLNRTDLTHFLFFNEDYVGNLLKKHKILFLNLAISHFQSESDGYEPNVLLENERKIENLKKLYGNTEIFKSFSTNIYDQGYLHTIRLPKFGSKGTPFQNEDFLIEKSVLSNNEVADQDENPYFLLKTKIPFTYSQIRQLCIDTIRDLESNVDDNDANIVATKVNYEKPMKVLEHFVENMLMFENFAVEKCKEITRSQLMSLFYFNAVLNISNGGLKKDNYRLFSATPVNYLVLNLYFCFRIFYVQPTEYFKELQMLKKVLVNKLSETNIHRFLYDSWFLKEMTPSNRITKKRPLCAKTDSDSEMNSYFNNYSPASHLLSCYSILEALKNLSKSMEKNEKKLVVNDNAMEEASKESINLIKASLKRDCLDTLILYLGLVYGMSWQMIKRLTFCEIVHYIIGFTANSFNQLIRPAHIMGLPSMTLHFLGIKQSKMNPFVNVFQEKCKSKKFEFGPLPNVTSTFSFSSSSSPSNETFINRGVFSKILDEIYSNHHDSEVELTNKQLVFILNNYSQTSFETARKRYENRLVCDAIFKPFYESLNIETGNEEFGCEDECEESYDIHQITQHNQKESFINSPVNTLITIRKLKDNHYQVNSIGDMALLAIILYKRFIGFELDDICFTKNSNSHMQTLVKNLIIQDYAFYRGFKLPGEKFYAKKNKEHFFSSNFNTEIEYLKSEHPISHPVIYNYVNFNPELTTENVRANFKTDLSNLITVNYAVDILRITSLNFILRSFSQTLFSPPFSNEEDGNTKRKKFQKILENIEGNFKDLPQMFILKSFLVTGIFEKELSLYKNDNKKEFFKFFMGGKTDRDLNKQEKNFDNIIQQSRFFVAN